jgi:hypothetical protein
MEMSMTQPTGALALGAVQVPPNYGPAISRYENLRRVLSGPQEDYDVTRLPEPVDPQAGLVQTDDWRADPARRWRGMQVAHGSQVQLFTDMTSAAQEQYLLAVTDDVVVALVAVGRPGWFQPYLQRFNLVTRRRVLKALAQTPGKAYAGHAEAELRVLTPAQVQQVIDENGAGVLSDLDGAAVLAASTALDMSRAASVVSGLVGAAARPRAARLLQSMPADMATDLFAAVAGQDDASAEAIALEYGAGGAPAADSLRHVLLGREPDPMPDPAAIARMLDRGDGIAMHVLGGVRDPRLGEQVLPHMSQGRSTHALEKMGLEEASTSLRLVDQRVRQALLAQLSIPRRSLIQSHP